MRNAAAFPVAGGASVALHLGMAFFLALAIAPKPFAPQKPPESRLAVEAYQVDRTDAAEARPQAEAAAEQQAEGAELSAGAVPQSRAEPQAPAPERLASAAPPAEAAAPAQAEAATLAPAPPPAATLAAVPPPAQTVAAAAAPTERPVAALPPAQPVAAAAPPVTAAPAAEAPVASLAAEAAAPEAIPVTRPEAPALASATPPTQAAPAAIPEAPQAPAAEATGQDLAAAIPDAQQAPATAAPTETAASLPPPAEKGTATLAWAGEDGTLDPKSLDAIQAFMQPGDVSAAASDVRDGIEGLLASVPCARLQVEFSPETGALTLRGHIPEEGLRGPVLAALTEQIGTGIPVSQDLRILPRPQCGALSGIGDVGLPQSTELLGNPKIIGSDGYVAEERYRGGDYVNFTMEGLDYPAYVYVDYFFADGTVAHLVPNETVALSELPPKAQFRVGNEKPGPGELALQVGPPYGQEIAVAFAASVPLYDGLRPLSEPADAYLEFLKERVAETREENPDFKGEWVYFFISTSEH